MVPWRLLWWTMVLAVLAAAQGSSAARRRLRGGRPWREPPFYVVHNSSLLPRDVQVSVLLQQGLDSTFFYYSPYPGNLSISVTPCSSPVSWSVHFRKDNDTAKAADRHHSELMLVMAEASEEPQTVHLKEARKGLYLVTLRAERGSLTHLYLSTEPGGAQALNLAREARLRVQQRQQRSKATVRWEQSLVDPHVTEYCLVVNPVKNYTSLCQVQAEELVVFPFYNAITKDSAIEVGRDPRIRCVGSSTHVTLSNLQRGVQYYLNLFAINRQSNLSYPFGSAVLPADRRIPRQQLKDGRAVSVNLRRMDGKAVFRYKVPNEKFDSLNFYIMPCGASVTAVVLLRGQPATHIQQIDGYGSIAVKRPEPGQRYYLRVLAYSRDELRRTSNVEVIATTRPSLRLAMPNMPMDPQVFEYKSMRTCESVTVGWRPSPGVQSAYYCLIAREGRLHEGYQMPNQCGLENRLRKSTDFAVKECRNIKHGKTEVITQRVASLKPGQSYVLQVTVKKPKGRTLSYGLVQVHTKLSCEQSNHFN